MDTGHGSVDQRQKKGGRECRPSTRGRMRRRCWRPSDTTLFNQPAVPWASFTNCQKKGVFPKHPRVRRIAPSPKKHPNDDVRFSDWSSPSRQNNGCGQQLKKKTWLPRRYGYKRLSGAFWCRPLRQLCFNPRHDRSRPHHNLHGVRTACVVYLLACFSDRNGFPRDLLMRSTSRRLALEHRFASTVLWSLFAALIFQALASR